MIIPAVSPIPFELVLRREGAKLCVYVRLGNELRKAGEGPYGDEICIGMTAPTTIDYVRSKLSPEPTREPNYGKLSVEALKAYALRGVDETIKWLLARRTQCCNAPVVAVMRGGTPSFTFDDVCSECGKDYK